MAWQILHHRVLARPQVDFANARQVIDRLLC
jgi:hypothetical protein